MTEEMQQTTQQQNTAESRFWADVTKYWRDEFVPGYHYREMRDRLRDAQFDRDFLQEEVERSRDSLFKILVSFCGLVLFLVYGLASGFIQFHAR